MNQVLLDKITTYSQQNGYRPASKRVAVAMALGQFNVGIDADSLWISMRNDDPRISRGTVYSSLKWLTESGVAIRKVRDDRVYVFALRAV